MKYEKQDKMPRVLDMIIQRVSDAIDKNENIQWSDPLFMRLSSAYNCIWGTTYKGFFNRFMLAPVVAQFHDPRFVAHSFIGSHFRSDGTTVKKGEKGTYIRKPIVFTDVNKDKAAEMGLTVEHIKKNLKDYRQVEGLTSARCVGTEFISVFNIQQTMGIIGKMKDNKGVIIPQNLDTRENKPEKPFQNFQEFFGKINPTMFDAVGPCYSPQRDAIGSPNFGSYRDTMHLTDALAHELIHWTGHESRLDRDLKNMGINHYSQEELIACLGSSLLLSTLGVDMTGEVDRQAAYLKHWLGPLKNDPEMLIRAASAAEKSVGFLLDKSGIKIEAEPEAEVA
jgi:antirestriction protein ArdC